jgi:class 3 adenylate cyclase
MSACGKEGLRQGPHKAQCHVRHNRFQGRFDYAAIGTVSNVASRLCDEAKPGQILISPRVLMKVENAVKVEPVGEFELKGIRRPLAAYNVLTAVNSA